MKPEKLKINFVKKYLLTSTARLNISVNFRKEQNGKTGAIADVRGYAGLTDEGGYL